MIQLSYRRSRLTPRSSSGLQREQEQLEDFDFSAEIPLDSQGHKILFQSSKLSDSHLNRRAPPNTTQANLMASQKSKTALTLVTAAGASAVPASAVVNLTDLPTPLSANDNESIYFNLVDQNADTASFVGAQFSLTFNGSDSKPALTTSENDNGSFAINGNYVANIASGSEISSSLNFDSGLELINLNGSNDINWAVGTRGFVGLTITNGGTTNFGWADIEYAGDQRLNPALKLYRFAYEDDGSSIEAGAVPEPRAAALLAALAAGSAAMLGRRRQAAV